MLFYDVNFLSGLRQKKIIFENKKNRAISRWCRRGGAAIAAVAIVIGAIVQEPPGKGAPGSGLALSRSRRRSPSRSQEEAIEVVVEPSPRSSCRWLTRSSWRKEPSLAVQEAIMPSLPTQLVVEVDFLGKQKETWRMKGRTSLAGKGRTSLSGQNRRTLAFKNRRRRRRNEWDGIHLPARGVRWKRR
jgi:hypothetical protein